MASARQVAPLSPVLLAGWVLRPLPPRVLQPILDLAMAAMRRRHPDVFRRLATLGDSAFLIDPVDLPFRFLLRPGGRPPRLSALGGAEAAPGVVAKVSAPLATLIALLEGRLDGDALFFSRELVVEHDAEPLLVLRNAIDGAGIDLLETALARLGPLAPVGRRLADSGLALHAAFARDLLALQEVLTAPLGRRCERQSATIEDIRQQLAGLTRGGRAARHGTAGPAAGLPRR